ncbi:uncharacterized protein [Antedon mediterranea]|uniref:uncharacterized protein n=1 Tax=Antedon mediterranea TaxID=105859 RepID=UPI003AF48CF9
MSLPYFLENGEAGPDDEVLNSDLPDPEDEDSEERAAEMRAANAAVNKIIHRSKGKKKRGPYVIYNPEIRARIGQHATDHGITSACRKFSSELGKKMNESTVRAFKEAYQKQLAVCKDGDTITNLPIGNRGRPPLLGSELDQRIQDYIRRLQTNGVPITRRIVLGAARGMVEQHDSSVMRENGGNIDLTEKWAQSFMARMSITPRKSKKRKLEGSTDTPQLQSEFAPPSQQPNSNARSQNHQQQPTTAPGPEIRKENDNNNIEIIKDSLKKIVENQMQALEIDCKRMEIDRRRAENEHQFFQNMLGMMAQVVGQMCQQQPTF